MNQRHEILIEAERLPAMEREQEAFLRHVIETALTAEKVLFPCEVNVLLTDDAGIRDINREQRGIDDSTDVLSFPAFDLTPPMQTRTRRRDG